MGMGLARGEVGSKVFTNPAQASPEDPLWMRLSNGEGNVQCLYPVGCFVVLLERSWIPARRLPAHCSPKETQGGGDAAEKANHLGLASN